MPKYERKYMVVIRTDKNPIVATQNIKRVLVKGGVDVVTVRSLADDDIQPGGASQPDSNDQFVMPFSKYRGWLLAVRGFNVFRFGNVCHRSIILSTQPSHHAEIRNTIMLLGPDIES